MTFTLMCCLRRKEIDNTNAVNQRDKCMVQISGKTYIYRLSERLVSFGIIRTQLRAPLKPRCTIHKTLMYEGFQGTSELGPVMPRNSSLSDKYTFDDCNFCSMDEIQDSN